MHSPAILFSGYPCMRPCVFIYYFVNTISYTCANKEITVKRSGRSRRILVRCPFTSLHGTW